MAELANRAILDGEFKYFEAKKLVDCLVAKLSIGQFKKLHWALGLPDGPKKLQVIMEEAVQLRKRED